MIKQRSKADRIKRHTYGKFDILPLKSTCYYKQSGSTTPSPTCVIDGATFKKTLSQSVHGTMSPKTLNDVTEIYMKHSAGHNEPASETAQNIIVDVMSYFFSELRMIRDLLAAMWMISPVKRTQKMIRDLLAAKNVMCWFSSKEEEVIRILYKC